jgi:GlpG protein
MRRIGTLTDRRQAERFGDFLLTRQIAAQIDPAGDEWAIWVHEEDRLDEARNELQAFRGDPDAERYQDAVVEADRIRHAQVRKRQQARRKTVNMTERWRRPLIQQIPVTFTLIVISVVASLGTRFGNERDALGGHFNMVSRMSSDGEATYFPADYRALPGIRDGQLWRLFTPAFLHLNPLHLLMNMYMTALMGGAIERARGGWTVLWLFLWTGLVAHLAQLYGTGPAFGGMSGVDFGFFGFMWICGRLDPLSPLALSPRFVSFMIAFLLICLTPLMPISIGNYAHFGGLFAGMLAGAMSSTWRRLRQV